MSDIIPATTLKYCHAELPGHGMIGIKSGYLRTFHRGSKLKEFPETKVFDTLEEAMNALPKSKKNVFVIAFPENKSAEMLWFTQEQKEAELQKRLELYRTCYGKYSYAFYRKPKAKN